MSLFLSLLIHALLVAPLLFSAPKSGGHPAFAKRELVVILEKPADSSKDTKTKPTLKDEIALQRSKQARHLKDECPHFYGGVGLEYDFGRTDRVTQVVAGYPADLAGVRAGDILLNADELEGAPGTPVIIKIERSGYLEFSTYRDKICTGTLRNP
jgi:hypothetical protein